MMDFFDDVIDGEIKKRAREEMEHVLVKIWTRASKIIRESGITDGLYVNTEDFLQAAGSDPEARAKIIDAMAEAAHKKLALRILGEEE